MRNRNQEQEPDIPAPTQEELEAADMDAIGALSSGNGGDDLAECPTDNCSVCPEAATCPDRDEVEAMEQTGTPEPDEVNHNRFRPYYAPDGFSLSVQERATFHRLINYARKMAPENENLSRDMLVAFAKGRMGELGKLLTKTIELDGEVTGAGADTSYDMAFTAVSIGQEIGNIASLLPNIIVRQ